MKKKLFSGSGTDCAQQDGCEDCRENRAAGSITEAVPLLSPSGSDSRRQPGVEQASAVKAVDKAGISQHGGCVQLSDRDRLVLRCRLEHVSQRVRGSRVRLRSKASQWALKAGILPVSCLSAVVMET